MARSSRSAAARRPISSVITPSPAISRTGCRSIVLINSGHRVGVGNRRGRVAGSSPRAGHGRAQLRQGIGPDVLQLGDRQRAAADHRALLHAVGPFGAGRRHPARHRRAADFATPITRSRPVFREADLRRHLINEVKADNVILEEDTKTDPRFAATARRVQEAGDRRLPAPLCAADDRAAGACAAAGRGDEPLRRCVVTDVATRPRALVAAVPAAGVARRRVGVAAVRRAVSRARCAIGSAGRIMPRSSSRCSRSSCRSARRALLCRARRGADRGQRGDRRLPCRGRISLVARASRLHHDDVGRRAGDLLEQIMKAPIVRCDAAQWTLFGISLAGFNAIISLDRRRGDLRSARQRDRAR